MCNFTDGKGSVSLNGVKGGGVEVAWTLWFYFCGVTHDWMSSIFEILILIWLIAMCLISSLEKIYVLEKLLTDDV